MLSCRGMAPCLSTHSPTACGGKVVAPATKGGRHFQRPQGGCPVFAAKGGIYTGAPKGAHLASAAILYTSRGRSPQPVREASAGPGQNPWRPGPKARRRHQPSRRSRVNLREYWKAPSRSRPRQRRLNPQAPQGLVHKKSVASQAENLFESFEQRILCPLIPPGIDEILGPPESDIVGKVHGVAHCIDVGRRFLEKEIPVPFR